MDEKEELALITQELERRLCRESLLEYCKKINPNFETPNHIHLIAEHLQKIETGEIDRLIVELPPRHGKSFLISEYFPTWFLGKNPSKYVIACSYGDDLATDFGRKVRNRIAEDQNFKSIFNNCELATDSKSSSRFDTKQGGSYFAVGRGGPITGRGGHLIIIDDLIKNSEEARSEAILKQINEWYSTTLYTRLMPQGAIVIVLTRWTYRDIIGHVKELEKTDPTGKKWTELKLPAINEKNEALWPERYPIEVLESTKHQIGTRAWNSLYMQDPTIEEGAIIKRQWLKYYEQQPAYFDDWILSLDASFKESSSSGFVVFQVWAKKGGEYYLIDQVRDRMDFPTTLQMFKNICIRYPQLNAKLVEVKANGQAIVDTLKKEISGIIEIIPKESKEARVSAVAPFFEAGNIYLPKDRSFSYDFTEEICGFPFMKHDDMCLVAGTNIATIFGNKPIEKVMVGDIIITPLGLCRVLESCITGFSEVIESCGITGTSNHKVITHTGLKTLDAVSQKDIIKILWNTQIRYALLKLLCSIAPHTDSWVVRENIICLSQKLIAEEGWPRDCMLLFLKNIIIKLSQQSIMSIIKMATHLTMTLVILSVFQSANIVKKLTTELKRFYKILIGLDHSPKLGIPPQRVEGGTRNMLKNVLSKEKSINVPASTVVKSFSQSLDGQSSAATAAQSCTVTTKKEVVYNLKTEHGVYFANGILVSNCDACSQMLNWSRENDGGGFRVGFIRR